MTRYRGIILLDSLCGIGIFLSTLLFATAELSYFFKITAELDTKTVHLLTAINTLNSIRAGQTVTDPNLTSFEYAPNIECVTYAIDTTRYTVLVQH